VGRRCLRLEAAYGTSGACCAGVVVGNSMRSIGISMVTFADIPLGSHFYPTIPSVYAVPAVASTYPSFRRRGSASVPDVLQSCGEYRPFDDVCSTGSS
jgi:hypothetical protein